MEQKRYIPNIPILDKKRVVIVGGGFAGLKLVRKLLRQNFQIILLDKNNFHQFQPLLYQVATAGLEPSAISFPLRKVLQKEKNIHFRIAEITEIFSEQKRLKRISVLLNTIIWFWQLEPTLTFLVRIKLSKMPYQ